MCFRRARGLPRRREMGLARICKGHLFIGGHSAGGHYAALIAARAGGKLRARLPAAVGRVRVRRGLRPERAAALPRRRPGQRSGRQPALPAGGPAAAVPGRVRQQRLPAPHPAGAALRGGGARRRRRSGATRTRGPHPLHRELRGRRGRRALGARRGGFHAARESLNPSAARTCSRRRARCGWRRDAPGRPRSCGAAA